jgi:drug/metabolite transporter (DMT)-like permease
MATLAWGIVLFAMSKRPMAGVAALRETSVIFAALIGTRLLHEPFGGQRVAAALGLTLGILLLEVGTGPGARTPPGQIMAQHAAARARAAR